MHERMFAPAAYITEQNAQIQCQQDIKKNDPRQQTPFEKIDIFKETICRYRPK